MILFPAIDLRDGKCVRLLRGDPDAQTVYADDPAEVAAQFAEAGAEWLHVVNLDGALGEAGPAAHNLEAVQAILDGVDIPIQVGGGIRTIEDIEHLLAMGVTRVILGTMAVERTRQMPDILARFGPTQILVSLDTRQGRIATHGWRNLSDVTAVEFGRQLRAMGVTHAVHTDIGRDGTLAGLNLDASLALAEATGLRLLLSGGVATLDDVRRAAEAAAHAPIEGLIIGRALYTGNISLPDALEAAAS